ncbi:hypothetical protein L9F63_017442, partial [Diploptera punctata]
NETTVLTSLIAPVLSVFLHHMLIRARGKRKTDNRRYQLRVTGEMCLMITVTIFTKTNDRSLTSHYTIQL